MFFTDLKFSQIQIMDKKLEVIQLYLKLSRLLKNGMDYQPQGQLSMYHPHYFCDPTCSFSYIFPQVSESTEPVPNIWPIIRVRAVRGPGPWFLMLVVSGDSGHLLPASPQAGEARAAG